MIILRKLIGNINMTKEPEQQSPLELWFERVIDMPLEKLIVEDFCRAIRQDLCIDQLVSRVLGTLAKEPLVGEYYDGELIAALSTIKGRNLKDQKSIFIRIRQLISQLGPSDTNDDLRKGILKIDQITVQLVPVTESRVSLCAGRVQQLGGESPLSSPMVAKAPAYTLNQWPTLTYYTNDGWVEVDNNIVENALRTVSLDCKNFLFLGPDHGGERGALLYGLIGTCKLNDVDPESYLRHVFGVITD